MRPVALVGRIVGVLGALCAAGAMLPAARADDFPARNITIVVPYAPGGGTDTLARMFGQKLEERLGKPVVIENRPGAGAVIGANAVARAAPDGYTLLMGTSTPLAINATLFRKLPYDPARDFVPLALVANVPFVLVVNPSLPVQSTAELIAYARANPGKLSFGSAGAGSPHHLFMELFKSMTGTDMLHVPFKGSAPALTELIAGRIPLMFTDIPPSQEFIKAGRIRALGVSSHEVVAQLPGVPTIAATVPGFEAVAWQGLVAPAGTPKPVVDKLHGTLVQIEALPEIRERIGKIGMIPIATPPVAELQSYVKSEVARWGEVVRKAGAIVD